MKGVNTMLNIVKNNVYKRLKSKIKVPVHVKAENDQLIVDIGDDYTAYKYTLTGVSVLLNRGKTSYDISNEILENYRKHIKRVFFY